MKKIIIIDDRQDRKKLHLSDNSINELNNLESEGLLTIVSGIDLSNLNCSLGDYDIIAVHRSYLVNNNMFNSINDYIRNQEKYLIVFSGGISQNTLLNKGKLLNINSSDFYTSKLPVFIKEFCFETNWQSPLLKYLYGDTWRLTLLLHYRYLLWAYGNINDIDDSTDEVIAEELQDILWNGRCDITIEMVNNEIEKEKERRLNS